MQYIETVPCQTCSFVLDAFAEAASAAGDEATILPVDVVADLCDGCRSQLVLALEGRGPSL